jgi:hypothetical protein
MSSLPFSVGFRVHDDSRDRTRLGFGAGGTDSIRPRARVDGGDVGMGDVSLSISGSLY